MRDEKRKPIKVLKASELGPSRKKTEWPTWVCATCGEKFSGPESHLLAQTHSTLTGHPNFDVMVKLVVTKPRKHWKVTFE